MSEEAFAALQNRVTAGPNRAARKEPIAGTRNQLRKRKGPNKTEAAFGQWLKEKGWDTVEFESHTLKMPGGTRYTPDWVSADKLEFGVNLCFWEVKGFMREAARVRLKEFAAHFTMFRFFLVRAKDRSLTSWDIQEL